jgi:hypothetical protein
MKILPKMDYFLLNSFISVAEILDDFPHPWVSQCFLFNILMYKTTLNRYTGTNNARASHTLLVSLMTSDDLTSSFEWPPQYHLNPTNGHCNLMEPHWT